MTTLKHHSKVGRTVRLAVGLLLVAFTLLAGTVPAQAAGPAFDYPAAVDPGSIELSRTGDPDAPLNTGHRLQVTATWSVPDSAQGGETFGLTLPEEFSGYTGEFAIPATDDPTQTVANCVVSSGRAGTVTCTLTDYVNERSDVRGELWFVVLVEKATQEDEVKFVVDDEVTLVELPGPGGIVGVSPLSPDYFKGGWIGQDGSLGWQVHFPGAQVEALPSVVVEDHLTPAGATTQEHYGVEGSIRVSSKTETGISERITNWTGGWNEDKTSFRIEIPGPFNPDASYYVVYHTEPIVTAEGDIYANEATISGVQVKAQQTWSASGGGNGIGKALGQFALSKLVTGTSATAVPSDTAFTVNYSYGDPVEERSMTVLADGTAVYSARVPDGTVVTLEEVNLPDVPGVVWGTPKFTGPGITELGDGRAQIALHEGGAVSLSLTNDAGETPPIPEEPITPEEPCTPGVPGTPAEPGTPEEPCVPEEPVTPEEPCTP
uniref:Ig-like domain-containing protein n=1 Tax=Leucobacter sp. USHLN154 TaxID=3081269 RepID=UPI0030196E91